MRSSHALVLGLIAFMAGSTGPVHAQVRFADMSPPQKSDLKHGTLVSLELDNGTKVKGHVVRIDAKDNRLFLRTSPGQAAVPYAGNDIKKIEAVTRPGATLTASERWHDLPNGLQENNSGVLRIKPKTKPIAKKPVSSSQNIVEPEILQQVIYNGPERSVVYVSSVISPGERGILAQLQKAENDFLALASYRERRDSALALEMSFQYELLKTQRLINFTLQNENSVNYPYPPAAGFGTLVNYYPLLPSYVGFPNYASYYTGFTGYAVTRSPTNTKGVIISLPQVVPPAPAVVDRLPPVDPQALAKARDELARLQSMAVYEDGRLVAVLVK